MLWRAALLLALCVHQAPAEYAKPVYIEDAVPERRDERIVSGWEARPGHHPHQVSQRQVSPTGAVSGCGGSIVHRYWILTAAHCTAGSVTIVIRAGVTHLTRPQYLFESTLWFDHPSFDSSRPTVVQPNDISLLKLVRPVVYSAYLRPIRVQLYAHAFREYHELKLYSSGYGRLWTGGAQPETLHWVYLRGVANTNCRNTFGGIITANTICAGFYNVTSQSICQGDSGGPLVHEDENGVPFLIGISSFVAGGSFGCHSGMPGGFTRPGPFVPWFKEKTGIDFDTLKEEDEDEESDGGENSGEDDGGEDDGGGDGGGEDDGGEDGGGEDDGGDGGDEESSTSTTARPPGPLPPPPPPSPPPGPPGPPKPPGCESEEDSDECDPEFSKLLKKLEVKVKVKVRLAKLKIKKKIKKQKRQSA